ncbi:MAG: GTP-binding protein [Candidatus Lokiarchaeota archaeon]|nr:GTP-binding protein [Candidatus Lokiarchaeota archaeon]
MKCFHFGVLKKTYRKHDGGRFLAIIKVAVLGDSEVGKTSFTERWTKGTFPDPALLKTTVGVSFDTIRTELSNGESVTLSVWDFGGQKRFIETLKQMVDGAKAGVLFFDASYLPSLDSVYNYWVPLIQDHGGWDFSGGDGWRFILVGNKIDLLGDDFSKVEEEMNAFCDKYDTGHALISAKTGVGMEQLDMKFRDVIERVLES